MSEDKTFLLEIVTPARKVFSGQVKAAVVPGEYGYFGVLPGHTPFLTSLKIGELKVETAEGTRYFSITGGFAEVLPGAVRILAETAEAAGEIDVDRARKARQRAQNRLREGRKHWDVERAQLALARAVNRLKIAQYTSS